MKKTILITGGCGFIGTSLIRKMIQLAPRPTIRILDNFSTGTPDDLNGQFDFSMSPAADCQSAGAITVIEGDVRDYTTALLCAKEADCIIHLAANTGVGPSVEAPRADMEANVIGTFNMLEASRNAGVKTFVFASSGAPAGEVTPPIHEELPPHPVSPYGASKLAGEGYCSAYYRTFGVNTVCLRFGNVYGPGSKKKTSVVAKFVRQALAGEPCVIYGDGKQTRDFIYIDDLVNAVLLSIEKDVGGETFQIATGKENTVWEIAQLTAKELEKRNIKMDIRYDEPRLGDVTRNFSDTRKAAKMLEWQANIPLETGIKRTVDYFIGQK